MSDTEIDIIYILIDGLCKLGQFTLIDEVLELEPKFMDNCMVLSILTITAPAKSKLKNRESFYNKCASYMTYGQLRGLE